MWVNAGPDTAAVVSLVRDWRHLSNAILTNSHKSPPLVKDLALLSPPAEQAPSICAQVLSNLVPCAILVPSDLVSFVPTALDGKFNKTVAETLTRSSKIT